VYAQVSFLRPNGTYHETLVFVDLGSPSTILSGELFKELQLGPQEPLTIRVGELTVSVDSSSVTSEPWFPYSIADNRKIEGLLPAGVLQKYQVVIDYAHRTLTLAQPGALKPAGIPVPFQVNEKTGLIAVEATISGSSYPLTVDTGSAYTWLRNATAQEWLAQHPDWQRAVGAVGVSNMRMADDGIEARGLVLRIPKINLSSLRLREVGALAIGPSNTNGDLIDWYSMKNPVPVVGWLGSNVLQDFRIMIDYPKHMSYWLRQSAVDSHDLDGVGLTLKFKDGEYFVAGITTQNGKATVEGAQVGDKLLQIEALPTATASWASIFAAVHGKPGELRTLRLERNGRQFTLRVIVTAF
jgi:hypothetical protein